MEFASCLFFFSSVFLANSKMEELLDWLVQLDCLSGGTKDYILSGYRWNFEKSLPKFVWLSIVRSFNNELLVYHRFLEKLQSGIVLAKLAKQIDGKIKEEQISGRTSFGFQIEQNFNLFFKVYRRRRQKIALLLGRFLPGKTCFSDAVLWLDKVIKS